MFKLDELKNLIEQAQVLVLGDVILDEYRFGETNRISPEAPVQVVNITKIEHRLGGAANVAHNIKTTGANVCLVYGCGNDLAQQNLKILLAEKNINFHAIKLPHVKTTVKSRILSKNQQLLRFDDEEIRSYIQHKQTLKIKILQFLEKSNFNYNVAILSDYSKGMFVELKSIIKKLKEKNKLIIVDPKQKDPFVYTGVDILTPNIKEFQEWVGVCTNTEDIINKAQKLIATLGLQALIITRAQEGILCVEPNNVTNFPALNKQAIDVTGAGDTVIAMLSISLSIGYNITTSVFIASHAAGIVVGKIGTATITKNELINSITKHIHNNGIVPKEELQKIIATYKQQGKKIVLVNGCYDILHHGHIKFLQQAKALGDFLVVAVNNDTSVKKLKGKNRPINNINDRMLMLANLKMVDWVIPFSETTPGNITKFLSPNVLVKNGKNYNNINEIPETEGALHVMQNGGTIHLIPETSGISTTSLLEKIKVINCDLQPN